MVPNLRTLIVAADAKRGCKFAPGDVVKRLIQRPSATRSDAVVAGLHAVAIVGHSKGGVECDGTTDWWDPSVYDAVASVDRVDRRFNEGT